MALPMKFARTYAKLRCTRPATGMAGPSTTRRRPTFRPTITQILQASTALVAPPRKRRSAA